MRISMMTLLLGMILVALGLQWVRFEYLLRQQHTELQRIEHRQHELDLEAMAFAGRRQTHRQRLEADRHLVRLQENGEALVSQLQTKYRNAFQAPEKLVVGNLVAVAPSGQQTTAWEVAVPTSPPIYLGLAVDLGHVPKRRALEHDWLAGRSPFHPAEPVMFQLPAGLHRLEWRAKNQQWQILLDERVCIQLKSNFQIQPKGSMGPAVKEKPVVWEIGQLPMLLRLANAEEAANVEITGLLWVQTSEQGPIKLDDPGLKLLSAEELFAPSESPEASSLNQEADR